MSRIDSLLMILLFLMLAGAVALLAWDVIGRRKRARTRRQWRREGRWRAKFRSIFFADAWKLRRTRRLTDQRDSKSEREQQD
jgi:hypothetical protein